MLNRTGGAGLPKAKSTALLFAKLEKLDVFIRNS
jgi:hypothetical protein